MHPATLLLLGALYVLPDAGGLPAPDASQKERIDAALAALRDGEGEQAEIAVRSLALIGEAVLPAVTRRLNEAGAAERLLLLTAVRRLERAAPLLAQARADESPAIRSWLQVPRPEPSDDLRALAERYLDVLALAERKRRVEADEDLDGLEPRLGRPLPTFEGVRKRMRDRRLAGAVQRERSRVAKELAIAGGRALREGRLRPDLKDPVFMAYLALLREETGSFYFALTSLVARGPGLSAVLEPLLDRPNHDPRKILRLLRSVAPDRARAVYLRFASFRPKVQRALVSLADGILPVGERLPFYEGAALAEDGSVRTVALDAMLSLEAPAGLEVARGLLDPTRYGAADFARAARLLARCDEFDLLVEHATLTVPDDGSDGAVVLEQLRRASTAALRSRTGPAAERLGGELLGSDSARLRQLGVDLVADPEKLLALAERDGESDVLFRALDLGGPEVARRVVERFRAEGGRLPTALFSGLLREGCVDLLVELAASEDSATKRNALRQLGRLTAIDAKHEQALLGLLDGVQESLRRVALEALLPVGTAEAERRIRAAGPDALPVLAGRAEAGEPIPFAVPLAGMVEDADEERLVTLRKAAAGMDSVEPGLFLALFDAWEALPVVEDEEDETVDTGQIVEQAELLGVLARSGDVESARGLFERLLAGEIREPSLVLGVLKAATRLLSKEELARLLPLLEQQREGEYPLGEEKLPPPYDDYRNNMLLGGVTVLSWAGVEAALDPLCESILEPRLQPSAFDWRGSSALPYAALNALRRYESAAVDAAFRRALAKAESQGRLAALAPAHLMSLVKDCHERRRHGRALYEVALALCEVLERLPWEGEVFYEKMRALGGLARYPEAAAAARAGAARKRERGFREEDGFWVAERMEGRALLYDALASKEPARFAELLPRIEADPFLLNLAAWYTRFYVVDLDVAATAGETAVRASAGLYHPFRDTLATIRNQQGRPDEAVDLVDPRRTLPVKRSVRSRWYLAFLARAYLLQGDREKARQELESALLEDRRILPYLRADPVWKEFEDVFTQVDEDYLDTLFSRG